MTRPLLAMGVTFVLGVAACGTSGRDLADVPAGQTAPPRSTSSVFEATTTSTVPATVGFTLTSSAWTNGGSVPDTYSCSTDGISPPLAWANVGPQITELALIVVDPDAGGFVHWLVTGIPVTTAAADAAVPPTGGVEQTHSGGTPGWFPLCPPPGEAHAYQFQLLGFTAPPVVDAGDPAITKVSSLQQQAADQTILLGTFGR